MKKIIIFITLITIFIFLKQNLVQAQNNNINQDNFSNFKNNFYYQFLKEKIEDLIKRSSTNIIDKNINIKNEIVIKKELKDFSFFEIKNLFLNNFQLKNIFDFLINILKLFINFFKEFLIFLYNLLF